MESVLEYRIITNNPLVVQCVPQDYRVDYFEDQTFREILVTVRDMVYAGHKLYTHPLAGSVKPNETPYKSIVVSREPKATMDMDEVMIIASAVDTFDKFKPKNWELPERVHKDFQLIDYTLLCGALGLDALAGLSNKKRI